MPTVDLVVPRFDNTLGALLIGFAVSATAFGMLTIQVFIYYRRFPQDKAAYKVLAASIWFLSLIDQAFIGYAVYYYTITNYLNPLPLAVGRPQWTLILQMTLGAVVGAVVKACFTIRVWRFSYRNWWLTGFLFLLVFSQLGKGIVLVSLPNVRLMKCVSMSGTAITFTVKCFQVPSFSYMTRVRLVGSFSLGIGVLTDMSIAAALCFYLQRMRSSYSGADSLINKLSIYAVNTGILTSTVSLSTLILFNAMPMNFVFICMYFVLSKLYAISFLATLNTRKIIRGRGTDREGGKSATFSIVTESMRQSVRIPMQEPMPTIREEDWRDFNRRLDTKFSTTSLVAPYNYNLDW
ncbi:uncharacterized protein EDB91DRAFT_1349061 [Suillus paluster]|uniref:uncharacterized protein n=1 Tax=Suillus paluster TaxID=48578 RepID=UPI001B8673F3|nr:uncharacterized protein EDB91DRAFT_1349061 [Suillus paluster]KAG1732397.1 hypothetical protein EDB91DRAFT_1349061 [Suillus paluster]